MFYGRDKIDEDIERFRRSISQPNFGFAEETKNEPKQRESDIKDDELGLSDFFGLWGAALRIVMPWALAFAAALGLAGFLLARWVGG